MYIRECGGGAADNFLITLGSVPGKLNYSRLIQSQERKRLLKHPATGRGAGGGGVAA